MTGASSTTGLLVVGAVNLDLHHTVDALPRSGETVSAVSFARTGGGKAANMAAAAAWAGIGVGLVAAVGHDDDAAVALADLRRRGVDLRDVQRVDEPTGTAVVVSGPDDNLIVVNPGASAELDPEHVAASCRRFAGTGGTMLLTSAEVGDDVLSAVGEVASARGLRVVHNAAPARPVAVGLAEAAPVVVVNEIEARQLAGGDVEEAARTLAGRFGGAVVTLGAAGALSVDGGRILRHPADAITLVDSTGAGDAFCGVLAARLATGAGLHAAAADGVSAGAAAAGHVGARTWTDAP